MILSSSVNCLGMTDSVLWVEVCPWEEILRCLGERTELSDLTLRWYVRKKNYLYLLYIEINSEVGCPDIIQS